MTAEAVDLIFDCFLKSLHDKEGNYGCCQTDGNAGNRDGMNDRGKTFLLAFSYPL